MNLLIQGKGKARFVDVVPAQVCPNPTILVKMELGGYFLIQVPESAYAFFQENKA